MKRFYMTMAAVIFSYGLVFAFGWSGGGGGSVPVATTSVAGKVKPDGTTTITDSDGTIHSVGATPVKISGSTLDTLTDDTGFVTAKAVQDGHNIPHAAPGTSGNTLVSNGTDWAASATIDATKLTGNLPAISGASLTGVIPADASVTLAKMANMATASLIYRRTAATGVPEVNTLAQLKTDLSLAKGDVGLGNVENTALSTGNAGSATKSTNLIGGNGTTLLGATPYQSAADTTSFAVNTTSTKKFLRMTGTGTNGAAPAYDTVVKADISDLPTFPSGTVVGTTDTQTLSNKTLTAPEMIGQFYDSITSTSQGTASINIDGVSYVSYNYSNGASTATYTFAVTSAPASNKVRYVNLHIGGGAGVITKTYTNVNWLGTSGSATTITNKYDHYACEIRSDSKAYCAIVAEASTN